MGCDIHIYAEKQNEDGTWESLDTWGNHYDEDYESVKYDDAIYHGRNYALFATLVSGVRGEYSFSFEEKGLPDDVCEKVQAESDRWDCDAHSHSWLTCQELEEFVMKFVINPDRNGIEDAAWIIDPINEIIANLKSSGPEGADSSTLRVVFWFDN